jgi:hypothetical protein
MEKTETMTRIRVHFFRWAMSRVLVAASSPRQAQGSLAGLRDTGCRGDTEPFWHRQSCTGKFTEMRSVASEQ